MEREGKNAVLHNARERVKVLALARVQKTHKVVGIHTNVSFVATIYTMGKHALCGENSIQDGSFTVRRNGYQCAMQMIQESMDVYNSYINTNLDSRNTHRHTLTNMPPQPHTVVQCKVAAYVLLQQSVNEEEPLFVWRCS